MSTLVGPLIAVLLLKINGPGAVFAAAAALSAVSAGFAAIVRYETAPRLADVATPRGFRPVLEGARVIASDRGLAVITALTALQTFTRESLLVLSVVISIRLLGTGRPVVGVLTAAVRAGAVAGSLSAALVVGRGGLARSTAESVIAAHLSHFSPGSVGGAHLSLRQQSRIRMHCVGQGIGLCAP